MENQRPKIGEFLVQKGLISASQIPLVLDHSQKTGMRFGEAAVDLGVLKEESLIQLFGPQYKKDFFKVNVEYFPKETRDFFSHDILFKYGCLPLGQKKISRFFKSDLIQINVGLVDPSDEKCSSLKSILKPGMSFQFYLILPTDWIQIVKTVYQYSDDQLHKLREEGDLDTRICEFL